jgi:hypothetical protein
MEIFTETLYKKLDVEFKRAVKEWLLTIIAQIPVYTGTAKGTFAPVGRIVGRVVAAASAVSLRASQKKYFKYQGKSYPLGFEAGKSYASPAPTLTHEDTVTGRTFTFTFTNTLPYVVWNDMRKGPAWFPFKTPTPWKLLDAGAEAWRNYLLNEMPKRLPKLKDSIKIVTMKVR